MQVILFLFLLPFVLAQPITVYDGTTGKLATGWDNWSWAKVNLTDTTVVKQGDKFSASMICTGWQGFYLSQPTEWDVSEYNTFSFWINGGPDAASVGITVTLTATNNSQTLSVADYVPSPHKLPANTWVQILIPIASFGLISNSIRGFWFQANGPTKPVVYFEDILFTTSVVPPVAGPTLYLDASVKIPISDNIYGATIFWNADNNPEAYATFIKDVRLPLNRLGGDGTTRYNWLVDTSNSGNDWYFVGGGGNTSAPTPGLWYDTLISQNTALNVVTTVTIPMIQYINKLSDWHCSYPVSVYGNQSAVNPYLHPNGETCGNGVDMQGKDILDKDPLSHDIPNTPEIQKEWIAHIVGKWGNSKKSKIIYQLDNEVSNWAYMHRDVHPQPVTYSEIVNQTIIYAQAVKAADPTASVAAPSEIQFAWYPDWTGGKNTVFFLQQIKDYETKSGTIILDSYDVHYPDANDNHWPKLTDITRLRQTIDATYASKSISVSEWSLTGLGPLDGALATADQFGHFAANGVSWASIWGLNPADLTAPISYAFRIYRNYDGNGGSFGDSYVNSTTGDDSILSVHGAIRSSDKALTVLVINKEAMGQTSTVKISNFTPSSTSAKVFEYSLGHVTGIVPLPDLTISASGFSTTFNPFSLTMIVIAG